MSLRRRQHADGAVVLVTVLWALVILTALCLALHASVRSRVHQGSRAADESRRSQSTRSAIALAAAAIEADPIGADSLSERWAVGDEAQFSVELNDVELLLLAPSAPTLRFGLADEASRLNANRATVEMLASLPSMTTAAAEAFVTARAALAARIDAMAGELTGPAAGLTGPIADLGCLGRMLCEAMDTPPAPDDQVATTDPLWANPAGWPPAVAEVLNHLTVYSRGWNVDADGQGRVNLNAASTEELTSRLGGRLTQLQIHAIIGARQAGPFTSVGELLTRSFIARDDRGLTAVVTIPREVFRRIVDRLTVTDAAVLPGRVNVNTAPAEVLACLPGMNVDRAAGLVDRRSAVDSEQLRTLAWILDVLTDQQFRRIAPHVTTRSEQFGVLAVVVDPRHGTATCALAVIERRRGRNGVLHLERYRRIWDDPRQYTIAVTAGPPTW